MARDKQQGAIKLVLLGLGSYRKVTFRKHSYGVIAVIIESFMLCLRRMWGLGAQIWLLNKGRPNLRSPEVDSEVPLSQGMKIRNLNGIDGNCQRRSDIIIIII